VAGAALSARARCMRGIGVRRHAAPISSYSRAPLGGSSRAQKSGSIMLGAAFIRRDRPDDYNSLLRGDGPYHIARFTVRVNCLRFLEQPKQGATRI